MQSRETLTVIVPVPPTAGKLPAEFVTVAAQRGEAGVVTFVVAELPQAVAKRRGNSRDRKCITHRHLHDRGHISLQGMGLKHGGVLQ